jgi:uncharacterized protein YndB with AHSA1/START domain
MEISEKIITKQKTVNMPTNEVWKLWSTCEGLKKFFGRDNKIDLKINGEFEIYFLLDNEYGQKGSEGCRILSYLPNKMISFSWNVPPKFEKLRKSEYKTWVVVLFNELGLNKTEINLSHYGWPKNSDWDIVFDYFDSAWEEVLNGIGE